MRRIFTDDSLQAEFDRTGFCRVPMLSAEEAQAMLEGMENLRPSDGFKAIGTGWHITFLDKSKEYKQEADKFIRKVFEPHIARHLQGFEILTTNFHIKPPGGAELNVHQNWPHLTDLTDTTVTVWCPLVSVDEINGTLHVVPGSHKILPHIEGPMAPGYFRDIEKSVIAKNSQAVRLQAGECCVFDDGLLHWSPQNTSDKPRIAVQCLCAPKGAQTVFYHFDPAHPERFEMIEVDHTFYSQSDISDLVTRPAHWKSLGFVANKNRFINGDEFEDLLKRGPEIRSALYASAGR